MPTRSFQRAPNQFHVTVSIAPYRRLAAAIAASVAVEQVLSLATDGRLGPMDGRSPPDARWPARCRRRSRGELRALLRARRAAGRREPAPDGGLCGRRHLRRAARAGRVRRRDTRRVPVQPDPVGADRPHRRVRAADRRRARRAAPCGARGAALVPHGDVARRDRQRAVHAGPARKASELLRLAGQDPHVARARPARSSTSCCSSCSPDVCGRGDAHRRRRARPAGLGADRHRDGARARHRSATGCWCSAMAAFPRSASKVGDRQRRAPRAR